MEKISFAKLAYSTNNLGDDIQTLATLPFLGEEPVPFDRDHLRSVKSDQKYFLIMNGWWAANPHDAFPPAECFIPIFIGFHIAENHVKHFRQPHCIDYFKKYEPIGCRDLFTKQFLDDAGVKTFLSGCLSTTFPLRTNEPEEETIYMVDTARVEYLIPDEIKEKAQRLTHIWSADHEDRAEAVYSLMNKYQNASLVITTRLHAALTCSALGIPVVFFFNPEDKRASAASMIGLRMYQYSLFPSGFLKKFFIRTGTVNWSVFFECIWMKFRYKLIESINWNPNPLNLEEHKRKLRKQTEDKLQRALRANND